MLPSVRRVLETEVPSATSDTTKVAWLREVLTELCAMRVFFEEAAPRFLQVVFEPDLAVAVLRLCSGCSTSHCVATVRSQQYRGR